jgi:hypothetical protein
MMMSQLFKMSGLLSVMSTKYFEIFYLYTQQSYRRLSLCLPFLSVTYIYINVYYLRSFSFSSTYHLFNYSLRYYLSLTTSSNSFTYKMSIFFIFMIFCVCVTQVYTCTSSCMGYCCKGMYFFFIL